MAKKAKKSRTITPMLRRQRHIAAIVNRCLDKIYFIGTSKQKITCFHLSVIDMHLKGLDRKIGLQEVTKFFYDKKQPWTVCLYDFFRVDGKIEVVGSNMIIPDVDLKEVGDTAEDCLKTLHETILEQRNDLKHEDRFFYGYYINYGSNLSLDVMEDEMISAFFQANDIDNMEVHEPIVITSDKILYAMRDERFLLGSRNLDSGYIEIEKEESVNETV